MIVLGADTHKSSYTIAAVDTATGQVLGDKTIAVGNRGFAALVLWARAGSMASASGRLKTAGMCPAHWSGF
jgi:hypothetical protein